MSIRTIDPNAEHDDAFFDELENEILKNATEEPLPDPIDPRYYERKKHDRVPDVDVVAAPDFSIQNPSKTWIIPVTEYCFPRNLEATVELVKLIETEHKKIRAIGQRHSFSQTCLTDGAFIDLSEAHPYDPKKHNDTVDEIDQSSLDLLKNGQDKKIYFDVPGGMQIFMINKILCPEDKEEKARFGQRRMFNMGGGDVQSFAGAFSTGTHGSGGIHSAYHDMVRSILLVAGEGKVYRIEPGNGITDPEKHAQFYSNNPNLRKVALIQNDDKFNAALVSFGCFGVIYSAIIETKEMSLLNREIKYLEGGWSPQVVKTTIEDFMSILKDQPEAFRYIQFNPYPVGKNRNPSYLTKSLTLIKTGEKNGDDKSAQKWPSSFTQLPWLGDVIRFLSNHRLSPPRRLIELVLKRQRKGNNKQNLAYRIWNAGTSGRLMTLGTAIEFGFPVDKIPRVIRIVNGHLNQVGVKELGYYVNGPISLRFVRTSQAFLAPNYFKLDNKNYDWLCFIEIVRINGGDRVDDDRELELFKHLQRMLMFEGGRPHWGLNFEFRFTLEYLKKIYPEVDKWIEAKNFFDPNGTFESKFTQSWFRSDAPVEV